MPRRGSESDDSYRSRSRRKKSKKKSRRSSSSSPSTSRSSSSEKSKPRQYRHRSHSGDRSKRRHKSSHSKRHRRRSHSSSSSDSRSRSKKHTSRTKERSRRSISRSHSRSRSSKAAAKWSHSRSPSPKKSRNKEQVHKKDREIEGNSVKVSEEDMLREKLEAALKAAAMADAQLRQKGLLNDSPQKSVDPELSVSQQLKRAQAIEDINSESFIQQDFLSSRSWGNKSSKVSSETPAETSDSNAADDWRTNTEKLVHPSWFENVDLKMSKWKKKLAELRGGRGQNSDVGVL